VKPERLVVTYSKVDGYKFLAIPLLCFGLMAANESLLHPEKSNERAPESFKARFETSEGPFIVQVTRSWAPLGADRFYNLVKNGFYDGARFFRVRPHYVVQFGIHGDPAVTKAWHDRQLTDDPAKESNHRGSVSFASDGPDTRNTQIFINLADNAQLDARGFVPFGAVVEGMDVIERFYMGYGELAPKGRGPEQERIEEEGNAYLEKEFPEMDYVQRAVIQE
jgi:peptidyl-prolyl cis-trans isomerase A (cyclophilin A)